MIGQKALYYRPEIYNTSPVLREWRNIFEALINSYQIQDYFVKFEEYTNAQGETCTRIAWAMPEIWGMERMDAQYIYDRSHK